MRGPHKDGYTVSVTLSPTAGAPSQEYVDCGYQRYHPAGEAGL